VLNEDGVKKGENLVINASSKVVIECYLWSRRCGEISGEK